MRPNFLPPILPSLLAAAGLGVALTASAVPISHGKVAVSMLVLPECTVAATPAAQQAQVQCPPGLAYRASVGAEHAAAAVAAQGGASSLRLAPADGAAPAVAILTIRY